MEWEKGSGLGNSYLILDILYIIKHSTVYIIYFMSTNFILPISCECESVCIDVDKLKVGYILKEKLYPSTIKPTLYCSSLAIVVRGIANLFGSSLASPRILK